MDNISNHPSVTKIDQTLQCCPDRPVNMPSSDIVPNLANDAGLPDGYLIDDKGVYVIGSDESAPPLLLCSLLRVEATFCDADESGWGRLVSVRTRNNIWQQIPVLMSDLESRPSDVIGRLADRGLDLAHAKGAKDMLVRLLKSWSPNVHKVSVNRSGWVDDNWNGFVIGDDIIGETDVLPLLSVSGSAYAKRGSPVDWRHSVGDLCRGNPLLVLAVSHAFSGPLLAPLGLDGAGLHFRGASSSGKTTLLRVAASVWGDATLISQWRATSNGLEALAASRNDTLLPLDELAEISAKDLSQVIYMLANGTGKARMSRNALLHEQQRWRLPLISTGEISLEEKLAEAGQRVMQGHDVRLIDIEADAQTHGAFDDLHGAQTPSEFVGTLQIAAARTFGTAGAAFLRELINRKIFANTQGLMKVVNGSADLWLKDLHIVHNGPVVRVARWLSLIGVAGTLATKCGLTGWSDQEAMYAARQAFYDWYERRHDSSLGSVSDIAKELEIFISANEMSLRTANSSGHDEPLGWRDTERVYLTSSTWSKIFPGLSAASAAQELIVRQILVPEGNRTMRKAPRWVPNRPRLYTVRRDRLASVASI